MDSGPDIVVATRGEPIPSLVVEVKSRAAGPGVVSALKHQMIRMRAPTGMLVTPDYVSVFRDTFKSYSEESIEDAGSIATADIPDLQLIAGGPNEMALEDAVQEWLVQLQYRLAEGSVLKGDLLPLLSEHVAPALVSGEVRPSGPRPSRHTLHDG